MSGGVTDLGEKPPARPQVLVNAFGRLTWKDGDWGHVLEPEGHMWRWHAVYDGPGVEQPAEHNFGLIPGGAFVAIQRLVRYAGGQA